MGRTAVFARGAAVLVTAKNATSRSRRLDYDARHSRFRRAPPAPARRSPHADQRVEADRLHPLRVQLRHRGPARRPDGSPSIRGDKAHPASQGYTCEKALRLDHYQNGRHRLTSPLRRRADGSFEQIDWDTAIARSPRGSRAIRDAHGGETIFYYGGGGQGNHLGGAYSGALPARRSARATARTRSRRRRPASSGSTAALRRATRAATSSTPRSRSSSARTRGSRTASRAPA